MTEPDEVPASSGAYRVVLGAAFVLHVALLACYLPRKLLSFRVPIHEFDYGLHVYQVDRALQAFRQSGHLWSYDPFHLAGQPAGAIEDLTSKSVELFVILMTRFGVGPWLAFNAYVLVIHLAVPLAGWAAARLFGLSRLGAALTALFWVVLWYFDSFLHWCWFVGMISWGAASYLSVLVVALLYRAVKDHRGGIYLTLAGVATLVTLVHPFVVLTLVVPLAALYVRAFRKLAAREHAYLALGALASAATALAWIGPAFRFRHYVGTVDAFLWPTASYVLFDSLDLLKDVLMTGQPVRTAFRLLAFALCVVACERWRRAGDDRALPVGLLVGVSFAMAYASGYSEVLRQTQPYRHLGPATLAAALAAAAVAPELFARRRIAEATREARTALFLSTVLALPPLARTVLHYLPSLLPERPRSWAAFRAGATPDGTNDEHPIPRMGYDAPPDDYAAIAAYLEQMPPERGRVVVPTDWVLAEYLATFTRVPVLGGIPQRNVPHVAAHLLRHDLRPLGEGGDPFRRYLEQYAAGAVVTHGEEGPVDGRRDLLEPAAAFGTYRIYRVKEEPSYFAAGGGRVADQSVNAISIADARGPEVVLRFHWMETLRCRPTCTVERAPVDRDSVGFIRVRNPPARFEIFNAY